MLRHRYEPMNLCDLVPALGLVLDPVLRQLETLLDTDALFQTVKAALARRCPHPPAPGRPSTPVEGILRLLVVKHLYGWSYEATEHGGSDSLVLRQCCRVYVAPVPEDTTRLRWANLIQPATLHRRLDHVVELARTRTVTRGRTRRMAGTVVATPLHHPTDSTWLYEGGRVLGRPRATARAVLQTTSAVAREAVRDRTRSAKRQMQRLMAAARPRGAEAADRRRTAYPHLLAITQVSVPHAQHVGAVLTAQATPQGKNLAATVTRLVPVGGQVISPTPRRGLQGEGVPAAENVVRLFEPPTAIIRKGQPGWPPEFGRVLWVDDVEGGIVSRYAVLEGNPAAAAHLPPSLEQHRRVFQRPPRLLTGDRGGHSAANERYATTHGVTHVGLPKPGAKSGQRIAYEPQRWFRRGRNWRAGLAGRSSSLKRRHKLARCRSHATAGMDRWVGWGVMAHNLRVIAQATAVSPPPGTPGRWETPLSMIKE
jgi:IS5 family transposase